MFSLTLIQGTGHVNTLSVSALLRPSLLATKEITPAERSYLDRIAKMKGLQPGKAEALERSLRREMGLVKALPPER